MRFLKKRKIIAFLVLLIILFIDNSRHYFSNIIYIVFEKQIYWIYGNTGDFGQKLYATLHIKEIIDENKKLREQKSIKIEMEAHYQNIEKENKLLRGQLKIGSRQEDKLLLTKVLAINRNKLNSTLIIDKGGNDGVITNLAVMGEHHTLAGIISEVFPNSAKVLLIDDFNSSISIETMTSKKLGVLRGTPRYGLGTGVLDLITNRDEIELGEDVVTSGLDALAPGLPIGIITDIKSDGGNLFKFVKVELLFHPITQADFFILMP